MRKVTKILFKLLSATLLLLITLPVLLSLLLSFPSIQNRVVRYAADFATERLGARVSFDRITVGMLNRVKVRGFYVEDFDRDTMLYVGSVTAYLGGLSNLSEGLVINAGRVEDAKFILRETPRGTMNVKEVVDRISRRKGSKFKLLLRSADAHNISFRLDRLEKRPVERGVDYGDMRIENINAHIDNFYVDAGAVGGTVTSLDFTERSGFVLDNLSAAFHVDRGLVSLKNVTVEAEDTALTIPSFSLTADGWEPYRDFINKVRIDCEVVDSRTSSRAVGYFAPNMRSWDTALSEATASMHGTVADFTGEVKHVRLEDGGSLRAKASVKGLIDIPRTTFDVTLTELDATTPEVVRLVRNIARLNISEKILPYLDRTERVRVEGRFAGRIANFTAAATVGLGSGGVLVAGCDYADKGGVRDVSATLTAQSLSLARLLGSSKLGDASFKVDADAVIGEKLSSAEVSGRIDRLSYLAHAYQNVSFEGGYADEQMQLAVDSQDEALRAMVKAVADLSDEEHPACVADVEIERADLCAMNINRRDSVSHLKASVGVTVVGRTLDELDGEATIANALYVQNNREVVSELATVRVAGNEDTRSVSLVSDFADLSFESRSSYKDVILYMRTLLSRYAPQFFDAQTLADMKRDERSLRGNVALLSVTTKRLDPLLGCIVDGIEVAEGTTIEMLMNPVENRFLLRGSSDFVSRNRYLATGLRLNAGNRSDSLTMSLVADDFYVGVLHVSELDLRGGVNDNKAELYGTFADTLRDFRGEISADAVVSRKNGARHIAMRLLPSRFVRGNKIWRATSDGVDIDSSRVAVRNFRISNDKERQYLSVNGVASRSDRDSIMLKLENFSVSPFTQFTRRIGYEIDGRTNGYVNIKSVLRDSEIEARVLLDSLDVNGIPIPDMLLTSAWDFGRSRAKLSVSMDNGTKEIIKGFYSPSQVRYYATVQMDRLSMSLLDPLLPGIISNTSGAAKVDLTLSGQRRAAELRGTVAVSDLQTTIDYIGCTYSAPSAIVQVENNRFTARDVPIFDRYRNRGTFDFDLNLNHLSNIEYDIDVGFRNMEVMATTKRDNDMFYGSVFGSGTINVRGDKAGVAMDIAASTSDNSHFYMPLTDKTSISSADFVTFESAAKVDTTNYLVRKKMLFERRQRQRSSSGGALDIAMSIDVRPNTEVQLMIDPTVGDIIKGRGSGLLNLRINPKADIFEMYGDYTIEEGSYLFTLQNIINKKFVIESGSTIQWAGEPLDALLDINAIYKVKASLQPLLEGYISQDSHSISSRAVPVDCIIHLADRLTRPTVTFDVAVPSADPNIQSIIANVLNTPERRSQQFLYLLVANSFMSDSSTEASLFSASSAAITGFELLSNQLSNWLSAGGNSNIVFRYRPKTEQMMSDEVDFGFSQGLLDNRLLIEVEGNYLVDRSQVVNANSSFTGEAYVTWLIDKAGSLRLKGFTHTIDRFDENQGLQETGIGIYYKEDFDNAKDLKRRVINRFSRKRRAESQKRAENDYLGLGDDVPPAVQSDATAVQSDTTAVQQKSAEEEKRRKTKKLK